MVLKMIHCITSPRTEVRLTSSHFPSQDPQILFLDLPEAKFAICVFPVIRNISQSPWPSKDDRQASHWHRPASSDVSHLISDLFISSCLKYYVTVPSSAVGNDTFSQNLQVSFVRPKGNPYRWKLQEKKHGVPQPFLCPLFTRLPAPLSCRHTFFLAFLLLPMYLQKSSLLSFTSLISVPAELWLCYLQSCMSLYSYRVACP